MIFKRNVTMCASTQREKTVFTSNGHIVDIKLSALSETSGNFILRYEGNVYTIYVFIIMLLFPLQKCMPSIHCNQRYLVVLLNKFIFGNQTYCFVLQ